MFQRDGQLIVLAVTELEDMATIALNDMFSLSSGFEIGAAHPRQSILETLFAALTLPHRALRIHTIKMLRHVTDLKGEVLAICALRSI